jgi:hypothetical protein
VSSVRNASIARNAGVAGGVALFTLIVLDVLLRFATNSPIYQLAVPATPQLSRYSANATAEELVVGDLGVATPDSSDDQPRRVRTTIDAFGFRNEPGAGRAVVDLVVLGDSYGFGVGTTQDAIFASRLRDRFGFSVYNLSMPWTGPWAQFVNLTTESRRLKLREGGTILWVLFEGNDLDDKYGELDVNRIPRNGLAGRLLISLKRVRNRSPLYQMARRVRDKVTGTPPTGPVTVVMPTTFVDGKPLLFLKPYDEASRRGYQDVMAHPNYAALRQTVEAAKQLAGRVKLSLKIVLAPAKEEVYRWALDKGEPWSTSPEPSGFAAALSEICAGAGIEFLDLKPSFVAASKEQFERSGTLLWWRDDTHWNEEGHDLAASIIHRDLLARHGEPAPRAR